jgi:nucleotide-binding universal stress UspA family protein
MKTKVTPEEPSSLSSSSEQVSETSARDRSAAFRNLLVPIDFSEHSKKTVEYAAQLAALTGAEMKVVHVVRIPEYPIAFYRGLYSEHEQIKVYVDAAKRDAGAQLSLVMEQIAAKGLKAEPILRVGNPFEEIVVAAKETGASLIVIGCHGLGGLERMLLGSTAERVVQHAPCPVLVVKDAADHHGLGDAG